MDDKKPKMEDADTQLEKLAAKGVKVYDLRGKSETEQQALVEQLKASIKDKLSKAGLAEDFPLTFVAGSGKTDDPDILEEARAMGESLQAIVNGASKKSVMGAVAEAAKVKVGVTCEMIIPFEPPDDRYDIVVLVDGKGHDGLENRLKLIRSLTKKELAIHGGMGTLEEILGGVEVREEVATLTPYWQPIVDSLKTMHELGYIDQPTLDKIHPVCAKGTPIDKLSTTCTPLAEPEQAEFQKQTKRIVNSAKNILTQKQAGRGKVLGESSLDDVIDNGDFFILPPADLNTMLDALVIMVEKRVDLLPGVKAPNPGIAQKPLVVLNVDGCYDKFMEQWHKMKEQGMLLEDLSDLLVEVKVSSRAEEPDIREALSVVQISRPQTKADGIIRDDIPPARSA